MLYVDGADKPLLNPLIQNIKDEIIGKSKEFGEFLWWAKAFMYLKYAGIKIAESGALENVWKYRGRRQMNYFVLHSVVGTLRCVALETANAARSPYFLNASRDLLYGIWYDTGLKGLPFDAGFLDPHIDKLISEINEAAKRDGYAEAHLQYENYAITQLGRGIASDVYGKNFSKDSLEFLAYFWERSAIEYMAAHK